MDFPNTQVKTIPKKSERPTTLHGTKEASQAEVLVSTRQFFAAMDQRNTHIPTGEQRTPTEVYVKDNIGVTEVPTTTIVTTTISTPPFPKCSGYS